MPARRLPAWFAIVMAASSALCMLAAAHSASAADPVLEVRARMRLRLDQVLRSHHEVVVTGVLLDESTGEPMPGFVVAMRLGHANVPDPDGFVFGHAAPTDEDGGFRFVVPGVERDRYVLHLAAPGDSVYAAAPPIERVVDFGRQTIDLELHAPSEHPVSAPVLPIVLEAAPLDGHAAGVPPAEHEDDLPVELAVDDEVVATVMVRDGRAQTSIALPAQASAGKEVVLRASFAGDEARGPAEAVARIRLVDPVVIDLGTEQSVVSVGEMVHLTGRVRLGRADASGLPIVVRRIAAPDDTEPAEAVSVRTDADGGFRASLRAPLGAGRAGFIASLSASDARARGLLAASSEIVVVEVHASLAAALIQRRSAGLALAVGLAAGLALLALALLHRLRRYRRRPAETEPAVVTAPKKLFATLRLASDRRVAGRVRDNDRRRPLAGAGVTLRAAGGVHQVLTDDRGEFSFGDVEPPVSGPAVLSVELVGHVAAELTGQLPHRGEWASLEVALVPLRAELMRRYDSALAPYLREGERLGRRTPKELEDAALRAPQAPRRAPLAALRHLVEDRCFGERGVESDALIEAERLAERLDTPSPPL